MTRTVVASATKEIIIGFDQPFCVIGERINPTGRKKLAAELEAGDFSTVEKDAIIYSANSVEIKCAEVKGRTISTTTQVRTSCSIKPEKISCGVCSLPVGKDADRRSRSAATRNRD